MSAFHVREFDIRGQFSAWLLGSVALGALLGTIIASTAVLIARRRSGHLAEVRESARYVRGLFQASPRFARGFVRWKMRLDKIFGILLLEDLCQGSAVDLGCGYGIALAVAAFRNPGRRLIGCDIDKDRIRIAGQALKPLKACLAVADVRTFEFSSPGLILILDVLQYLDSDEQRALLKRCCAALEPGGKLIFRVPDTERRFFSGLTMALDGLIFRSTGRGNRPMVLKAADYEKILENAGMRIRKQHLINRLPLAHILFTAERPAEGEESVASKPVRVSTRTPQ